MSRKEHCHVANQVSDQRAGTPEAVVQHRRGPQEPAVGGDPPRHHAAGGAGRPGAALPHGDHPAGSLHGAVHRHSGARARRAAPVAADAPAPGAPAGEGARYAGQDFLQVRGCQPGRFAQAEHRNRPGFLQQAGRHQTPDDRDRRRPVGQCAVARRRVLWPRGRGLHGQDLLQPEALSPRVHGELRRQMLRQPV